MAGMTPGRTPTKGSGPQNYTPRSYSGMPGRVRRSLDGQILSKQRNGETIQVMDGRLEVRVADGGGLKMTSQGLMVDLTQTGEKNRPPLDRIMDPVSGATTTQLRATIIELLAELRRTGSMR